MEGCDLGEAWCHLSSGAAVNDAKLQMWRHEAVNAFAVRLSHFSRLCLYSCACAVWEFGVRE